MFSSTERQELTLVTEELMPDAALQQPTRMDERIGNVKQAAGRGVVAYYNGQVEASRLYSATLNGQPLAAGVYNCQLITNGKVTNQRLLVSK